MSSASTPRIATSITNRRVGFRYAALAARRVVEPRAVDVLAAEEVDQEEHERERHPRAEALGDAAHRAGPARADDHERARDHDAALREDAEVEVVHVEGAPRRVRVEAEAADERERRRARSARGTRRARGRGMPRGFADSVATTAALTASAPSLLRCRRLRGLRAGGRRTRSGTGRSSRCPSGDRGGMRR